MSKLIYIEYDIKSDQTIYRFNGVNPLDLKVLDEIVSYKKLEKQLEKAEEENKRLMDLKSLHHRRSYKYRKQLEQAEEVIRFYGDLSNFGCMHCGDPLGNNRGFYIYDEEGNKARNYFKKKEGGK